MYVFLSTDSVRPKSSIVKNSLLGSERRDTKPEVYVHVLCTCSGIHVLITLRVSCLGRVLVVLRFPW